MADKIHALMKKENNKQLTKQSIIQDIQQNQNILINAMCVYVVPRMYDFDFFLFFPCKILALTVKSLKINI